MSEVIRCYCCHNVGLAGTTPVAIQETKEGFEARMGFAVFGSTNMDEEEFRRAEYNPFHEAFHDNYASGKGATEEEAIAALKASLADTADSLWA